MPAEFWHFLRAVELSGFSKWMRESESVWAYPTLLFFHTLGLAFVVGMSLVISLRILGVGPGMPLKPMEKFFPILWVGFWINTFSGIVLLAIDATFKFRSPTFGVKMVCIALAVISVQMIRNRVFRDPDPETAGATRNAKILAASAIVFWVGAIAAGRLLAYLSKTHIVGSDL